MAIAISRLVFATVIIGVLGQARSGCLSPGERCDHDRTGCCGWKIGGYSCRSARKGFKRVYKCKRCKQRSERCGDDSDCCFEHACKKACPKCKNRCWKGCMQKEENCRESKDCCKGYTCVRDGLTAKKCHACLHFNVPCTRGGVPCCFGRTCQRRSLNDVYRCYNRP